MLRRTSPLLQTLWPVRSGRSGACSVWLSWCWEPTPARFPVGTRLWPFPSEAGTAGASSPAPLYQNTRWTANIAFWMKWLQWNWEAIWRLIQSCILTIRTSHGSAVTTKSTLSIIMSYSCGKKCCSIRQERKWLSCTQYKNNMEMKASVIKKDTKFDLPYAFQA